MNLSFLFDINEVAFIIPLAGYDSATYPISWLELWATITGLISVIGARMNKIWWYPIGILNCIGFGFIFYQIQLYSDLLLNVYFLLITFYGWVLWKRKRLDGTELYKIRHLDKLLIPGMIIILLLTSFSLGLYIDILFNGIGNFVAQLIGTNYVHQPASFPFIDAFTTVASVAAMYLLIKRYVESWYLWTIVNTVCIVLYAHKGVVMMSAEYVLFWVNSIVGAYQWHKQAKLTEN
jgi:nicotinamide mononucleotide transporter